MMERHLGRNRGQLALACIFSLSAHAAVGVLLFAGYQVTRSWPEAKEAVDTRCAPEREVPLQTALVIADERPKKTVRRKSLPTPPVQPPTLPVPTVERTQGTAAIEAPPKPHHDQEGPTDSGHTTAASKSDHPATAGTFGGKPLHSATAGGHAVVYVIDHSASMGRDGKLSRAIECVRLSLRELAPDVQFGIVIYHSMAEVMPTGGGNDLVTATPANIAAAEALLKQVTAEGSSRHLEGLRKGLYLQPDELFLLTDADDLSADQIRIVGDFNHKRTSIHPVLFGAYRGGASPFDALARQNHGQTQVIAEKR
jgi:hypothetical protein